MAVILLQKESKGKRYPPLNGSGPSRRRLFCSWNEIPRCPCCLKSLTSGGVSNLGCCEYAAIPLQVTEDLTRRKAVYVCR
jgi:hypothetical protein